MSCALIKIPWPVCVPVGAVSGLHILIMITAKQLLPLVSWLVSLVFFPGLKKLQICSIPGRSNNSPDFDAAVLPCKKISSELHTSHYSECRFSSVGCNQPKRQKTKKKEPLQINLNIFIIIFMSQTVHISYRLYLHIYQVVSYYILCTRWSNELVF